MPIIPAFDPDTGASGGPVIPAPCPPAPSPVTPPAATSEAVASGGTPSSKTFGAFTDPDGQIASYSAAIVNAVGTTSIASGSGLGPYDVSGFADEDGYALTLTALDASGDPLATAVHAVTIAAAAPTGAATWLEMVSKVYYLSTTPPTPDPSPYTWDAPTNGTGPYTYEVTAVGGGGSSGAAQTFNYYDQSTRTIYMSAVTNTGSNNATPIYYRVRAYDSVGNWGDTYIMFIYMGAGVLTDILPEIVMDETDPPVTYSFTVPAGWVGVDQEIPGGGVVGSGIVTPSPMKNTTTARYQGPFTVDPAVGAVLWLHTAQETTPGGGTNKWICQPFRRRRDPMTRFDAKWQTVIDWDMAAAGAQDPSAWTVPSAGSQTYSADFVANSFTEQAETTYTQLSAGSAAATEVAAFDATGLHCSMTSLATNSRAISVAINPRIANTHDNPTPYWPERWASIPSSDELVFRWVGAVTVIGAAATVTWTAGSTGANGNYIRFARGPTINGTLTADVIAIQSQFDAGQRNIVQVPRTEIDGVTIGVDLHVIGARRVVVVYIYGGSMPDLNSGINPYGSTKFWVAEGEGDTRSVPWLSTQGALGLFDYSASTSDTGEWQNMTVAPSMSQEIRLGNNGAADVQSRWTRLAIVHRPRSIRTWS